MEEAKKAFFNSTVDISKMSNEVHSEECGDISEKKDEMEKEKRRRKKELRP